MPGGGQSHPDTHRPAVAYPTTTPSYLDNAAHGWLLIAKLHIFDAPAVQWHIARMQPRVTLGGRVIIQQQELLEQVGG